MAAKNEKEARKALRAAMDVRRKQEFDNSLPMERALFAELFDILDERLSGHGCDHGTTFTKEWLDGNHPENAGVVLDWLADNGGYCDCEVSANAGELFE